MALVITQNKDEISNLNNKLQEQYSQLIKAQNENFVLKKSIIVREK